MTKSFENAFKECCEVSITLNESSQRTDIVVSLIDEIKIGRVLVAKGITRKSANKFKTALETYLGDVLNRANEKIEKIMANYAGMKLTPVIIEELEYKIRAALNEFASDNGYADYPSMFAKEFLSKTKIMTVGNREKNVKNMDTEEVIL